MRCARGFGRSHLCGRVAEAACLAFACVPFVPGALAWDAQKLEVEIVETRTLDLSNSKILVLEINVRNGDDDEARFFDDNFELLDADLRKYGATNGYELSERGESFPSGVCDALLVYSLNPGLYADLEVCFEMQKNATPDSLLIYDNPFAWDVDTAQVIPLVSGSVGYSALVEKNEPPEQKATDRVREIEEGGGCLIATAVHGTELVPEVQNLREIRNRLYGTGYGEIARVVNGFYYSFSPTVADWERESPAFRGAVKILITPMLASFAMLDHGGIDSEPDLVGYVAGVALLNLGMYVGGPAFMAVGLTRASKALGRS